MINFDMLVAEGMISPEDMGIFQYVESAEEAWKIVRNFDVPSDTPHEAIR
jgi:predicted Rossmann-fold nucleotide-binding protein